VLSHTTPSCAFRGFGTPQVAWAMESQLDEAARQLGIDRLAIRLRNLAGKGEEIVEGEVPADGDWQESVRMAAEAIGWGTPMPPGHGRGIAAAIKSGATTGLSYSTVRLLFDGSVTVYAGTSDMGQGARTIFAQIAADELGAALEDVHLVMGDTDVVPFDLQTSASRSTVFMGNAIYRACQDIHRQLRELAAEVTGVAAPEVRVERGRVCLPGGAELTVRELLATGLGRLRGELIGNGTMRKVDMPEHPLGGTPAFYEFNCTAFEVDVDQETGETLVVKHVTVGDVGKALNPLQVEMQDEGAAVMGLGHTMMEQVMLDEAGRIRNLGALDYRIPTTKDMPVELSALAVENEDGPGPYGAKGCGEGSLAAITAAVATAVADAGIPVTELPLTPERVWGRIQELEKEGTWPR
jgi:CO/xanthine dehydrogenase Mo-binding subunit